MDQTLSVSHPRIGLATADKSGMTCVRAEPIPGSDPQAIRLMATDGRIAAAAAIARVAGSAEPAWIPAEPLRLVPTAAERRRGERTIRLNGSVNLLGIGAPDRTYPESEPHSQFPPLGAVLPTLARKARYAVVSLDRDRLARLLDAIRPIDAHDSTAAVTLVLTLASDGTTTKPVAVLNGSGEDTRTDAIGVIMPITTDADSARRRWKEAILRLGLMDSASFDAASKTR